MHIVMQCFSVFSWTFRSSCDPLCLLFITLLKDSLRFGDVVWILLPIRASSSWPNRSYVSHNVLMLPWLLLWSCCQHLWLILLILIQIVIDHLDPWLNHAGLLLFHVLLFLLYEGVHAKSLYILVIVSLELLNEWMLSKPLHFGAVRVVEVTEVVLLDF